MAKFGVGQPVRRVEDQRLVTGRGRYTDDISIDGQAHGYVVRSPHAHARIRSIDTRAAAKAPGVLGVFTAKDFGPEGASVPCFIPITNKDGSERADPPHPILCTDKVHYVGDNVAFVVAETLAQARD
ncbi:MAG TPA: xanthine dehydrogenase family protein molybdopterin-binding subunit, partial [Geminicoccaceae bacterium]|nr:xanthine dehydrogenase family protein molybdopterin-binding subunit [Geminicoccaceae bacterium]